MVAIAITGGNGDVGTEISKQLSKVSEVTKIILTCRTQAKAVETIAHLVDATGKDASFFDYVLLDVMDMLTITTAVDKFPTVDRLLLNVGGLSKCKIHKQSGAVDCMVLNTLGHAVLAEGLIKKKKISAGGRIIYVGSEVCRSIYSFAGLKPEYYGKFGEKDIEWAIGKNYSDFASGLLPIRSQLGDYANAKIIGTMYMSYLAKENPELYILTVSPGAIGGKDGNGTGFANEGMFPMKFVMKNAPWLFKVMQVTHDLDTGVARIVDGILVGEPKWEKGSVILSPPPFWGARGPPVDNRPMVSYLSDEDLCEKTAIKVREWNVKWAANAGVTLPY